MNARANIPSGFPQKANVASRSLEREAMEADLSLIADIRAGAKAMRANGARYLPKYEAETAKEHQRRIGSAPWRPEFVDALTTLAAKPFRKDVVVAADTPDKLAQFAEDVDMRGNNLSVFARSVFTDAIANGVHAILVDYPTMEPGATIAQEKAAGARPYWISVSASQIIALRTEVRGGRDAIVHVRIAENSTEIAPDGYGEREVERVRVIEPDRWELWEKDDKGEWTQIDGGAFRVGGMPDEVPMVLLFTGERIGVLRCRPPLIGVADVQIELFRALSRQDEILTFAGSPMLAAIGMSKPDKEAGAVTVGPKTILFAPPASGTASTDWKFVSPDASVIEEVRNHIESVTSELRRLAMQPMTPRSGDISATATSVDSAKAHSALQAWALGLKDALERAYQFTAAWMGETHSPAVEVFTDFVAGLQSVEEAKVVLNAQAAHVISARTAREELQRRSILGPSFDEEKEDQRLAEEEQGLEPEINIDPATGLPIDPLGAY